MLDAIYWWFSIYCKTKFFPTLKKNPCRSKSSTRRNTKSYAHNSIKANGSIPNQQNLWSTRSCHSIYNEDENVNETLVGRRRKTFTVGWWHTSFSENKVDKNFLKWNSYPSSYVFVRQKQKMIQFLLCLVMHLNRHIEHVHIPDGSYQMENLKVDLQNCCKR